MPRQPDNELRTKVIDVKEGRKKFRAALDNGEVVEFTLSTQSFVECPATGDDVIIRWNLQPAPTNPTQEQINKGWDGPTYWANKIEPAESALDATLEWAARLARRAPVALSLTKQAMRDSFTQSLEETFSSEGPLQDRCMASQDFVEGITAFFEKREARFTGQ